MKQARYRHREGL